MRFFKGKNFFSILLVSLMLGALILVQVWNHRSLSTLLTQQSRTDIKLAAEFINNALVETIKSSEDKGAAVANFIQKYKPDPGVVLRMVHSESINVEYAHDEKEQPLNRHETRALKDGEEKTWQEEGYIVYAIPMKASESCRTCHHMPGDLTLSVPLGYTLGLTEIKVPARALAAAQDQLWNSSLLVLILTVVIFVIFAYTLYQFTQTMRDSQARYTIAARAGKVGVWDWKITSNEFFMDPTLKAFLGYFEHQVENSFDRWIELFHPDDRDQVRRTVLEHIKGKTLSLEMESRMQHRDGSPRWVMIRGTATRDNDWKAVRLMGTNTDITDRKVTELELEEAKKRAEEATKLKDKFVSLVAHDLRSPFNTMMGFLTMAMRKSEDKLDQQSRDLINRSMETGRNLVYMIEKLLDVSRLQTGNVEPQKAFFDLHYSILSVKGSQSFLADNKGITVENNIPKGTRVFADQSLLHEVFLNLVSNAVKFCKDGDTITVAVEDADKGLFSVKDTGIGISEDIKDNLFKHEVKTTTSGTGGEKGTGLGLPFCRDIMELHDGDLWVESEPGKGSHFFIRIPPVTPRLLILEEDDELSQPVLEAAREGTVHLETGADAGELIKTVRREEPFSLIIIDGAFRDAVELLKEARDKDPEARIIVVCPDDRPAVQSEATAAGAELCLPRPLDREQLAAAVRRAIG